MSIHETSYVTCSDFISDTTTHTNKQEVFSLRINLNPRALLLIEGEKCSGEP